MEPIKKRFLTVKPISEEKQETEAEQQYTQYQISSFVLFMKVGIIVLSIITIIGFGIKLLPGAVTVSNTNSKRDLPIYCVNTDENKVALSFDAAWGNGYLG